MKALLSTAEALAGLLSRTGQDQAGRAELAGERYFHATDIPEIGTDGNPNFKLGTHFGTAEAAEQRILTRVNNGDAAGDPVTYPTRIDIQRPYDIVDNGGQHSAEDIANAMLEDDLMDVEEWYEVTSDLIHWDMDTNKRVDDEAWTWIRDRLEGEGFDGISYTNMVEGAGSESVIPLRPEQVRGEFAQFDPDNAMSPNLMASAAGGAVAITAGMAASEKSQAGELLTTEEALALTGMNVKQRVDVATPQKQKGELGALDTVRGAVQQYIRGATFGSADEIVGAARAALDGAIDNMTGVSEILTDAGVSGKEQTFSETYDMMLNDERENRNAFVDQNPVSAALLEIAGGIATGGATVKAASALIPAAKVGVMGGATGLIDGAIYGYLDADTDTAGRFKAALKYGVLGGGLGVGIAKGVEKVGKHITDKASGAAADVVERYRDNLYVARSQGLDGDMAQEAAMIRTRVNAEELDKARVMLDMDTLPAVPSAENAMKAAPDIAKAQRDVAYSPEGWLKKNVGNKMYDAFRKSSDRLARISPELANDARRMEMRLHERTQKWMDGVKDWEKHYRGLNKGTRLIVGKALFNNDVGTAMHMLDDAGKKALAGARGVLVSANRELKKVGYDLSNNESYYPRNVKDHDGLTAQMGRERASELEQYVASAPKGKEDVYRAEWFRKNDYNGDGNFGNTKQRTIDQVSTEMMPYYGDAVESLSSYIHRAASDIEMKRFFNKNSSGGSLRRMLKAHYLDDASPVDSIDPLDRALDSLVAKAGILGDPKKERAVKEVLKSRFTSGRVSMGGATKLAKDAGTASALGHFPSTITQFGDLANAVYFNGFRDTVRSWGSMLAGKNLIKLKDLGVDNRLTQDLQTAEGMTKWVDTILTATGFKHMDRFGKATIVQGAVLKGQRQLKTAKGEEQFRKQWGETYGDELEGLITDLRNNVPSENVKLLAFNVLSDAQPISLLEMPKSYLDSPNGRIFYTLKSYAVNQLNILNNTLNDPRVSERSRSEAYKSLISFMTLTGVLNGAVMEARGVFRGDDFNIEDIPDNSIQALMGLAFVNRYAVDHFYGKGDIAGGLMNALAPPLPTQVPIVGQMVDDWALGGKEKRAERRAKEKGERVIKRGSRGGRDLR